jgi:hypothetical protein
VVIGMKFRTIRHKNAFTKLRKDEETEIGAEIELKDAIIEIDLGQITKD